MWRKSMIILSAAFLVLAAPNIALAGGDGGGGGGGGGSSYRDRDAIVNATDEPKAFVKIKIDVTLATVDVGDQTGLAPAYLRMINPYLRMINHQSFGMKTYLDPFAEAQKQMSDFWNLILFGKMADDTTVKVSLTPLSPLEAYAAKFALVKDTTPPLPTFWMLDPGLEKTMGVTPAEDTSPSAVKVAAPSSQEDWVKEAGYFWAKFLVTGSPFSAIFYYDMFSTYDPFENAVQEPPLDKEHPDSVIPHLQMIVIPT